MFWKTALPAAMLVAQAYAGFQAMDADELLARDSGVLERRMEYFGEDGSLPAHIITRRQTTTTVMNNGTINMTAWDAIANKACTESLLKLTQSTNPSGTCVCYNLPALNNVTGAFEADLRLYQLTQPSGEFANIPQQNIQVSLKYNGASVSPVSAQTVASMQIAKRQSTTTTNSLKLLQTYLFVGQIDQTKMTTNMNMATLEALVMPVVSLSAVNSSGQTVTTNVSSNEAAFVAGVFSDSVVMSTFSAANLAVDQSLAQLANGTVAFVLPGVQLMIFPFGLIIASVWLLFFIIAVGWGTIDRMGFREQYRRRIAFASKGVSARI